MLRAAVWQHTATADLCGERAAVEHGLVGKLLHERQMWQMVQPAKSPYGCGNVSSPAAM